MILNCEKSVDGQKFQIEDFTIYYLLDGCCVVFNSFRTPRNIDNIETCAWYVSCDSNIKEAISMYNTAIKNNKMSVGWPLCRSKRSRNSIFGEIQHTCIKKQKIRSVVDIEQCLSMR